ncbi:fibrous sheath CABYR-binding protein [Cheilinus undulatus]|uniref:fibrous sheath CABYR-binding protein n=1 Tax=Cheilinus undulatus TaxID=241271 RepID=UPI001BD616C1|nr:fibrous sheath CABYR-binding protein [Cheilinus undulatus]
MKGHLLLPLLIVVSVIVVGLMKIRQREHDRENRQDRFQTVKLRVTNDVLGDYQNEKTGKQLLVERAEVEIKKLNEDQEKLKTKEEATKVEADKCLADKTSEKSVLDTVLKEFTDVTAETKKEMASWKNEIEFLQKQLAARSKVCDYLKPGTTEVSQLCGTPAKEAKAEAPKEEAKAEPPKEEAKAEPPKEEAKAEPPKEEAKAEPPKEEAKAEAPKEEAKAEAPKEEAKAEAPKEEAKAEPPKEEAAKEVLKRR